MLKNMMKENFKVYNVFTSLDFGGVESRAVIISRNSQTSVVKYLFLAVYQGGDAAKKIKLEGNEVILLNQKPTIPSPKVILSLYREFKKIRPDIVHTRGAEANFHGLIAAWLAGVPVRIGEEIGIPNHSFRAKLLFKLCYLFANKVVGISDAVTNWLIETGEVPVHKAIRVYNPVAIPEARCVEDIPSGRFRIGFVGRLEPVKNPLALVEALAILVNEGTDAELCFVGDGSQKNPLIELASGLGLSERVIFHGFQDNPAHFVRQCHLYVQPSISEGFGLALVEAMGCAVPVLATAVGGAPEIIRDGETGWLVDKTDSVTLASKLIKLSSLPGSKLIEVGIRGRESVKDRFDPASYMVELEKLYISELEKVKR
ncbi:glycosyltransferase [Parahaliea sp. F7430]|uniref:Glycosyltransferase n=1 Tax=Sediminihaliea albiluteola TaxID=2758564 RepID=A0A7W2TUN8_9GAMM|nr:glycosyltransferase [Sediminihaliea albiluteola]MBA6412291.1 glycosyltransferase [Sediminihaliea albiluteola]